LNVCLLKTIKIVTLSIIFRKFLDFVSMYLYQIKFLDFVSGQNLSCRWGQPRGINQGWRHTAAKGKTIFFFEFAVFGRRFYVLTTFFLYFQ